jgi:hypothetical protein
MKTTPARSSYKSQSLETLTALANKKMTAIEVLERKMAIHAFQAGELFFHIREKLMDEGNEWSKWQTENGFNRGTVNRWIKLYENAATEENVTGKTIGEAEKQFCVREEKQNQQPKNTRTQSAALIQSPTEQALEALGTAYSSLSIFKEGGERKANSAELADVKALAAKLLALVAELESAQ